MPGRFGRFVLLAGVFGFSAYMFTSATADAQSLSVLYNFDWVGNSDPTVFATPGTMVQGRDGNIYTTSVLGGISDYGTVLRMTPGGVLSVPLTFGSANGGADPYSGLTLSRDGNFYGGVGFTYNKVGCNGLGSVFKVTSTGTLTYLYTYPTTGAAGYPMQAPVQGTDGNYY
ncbi:MAG TPA: choice-of-anchor tandem repeat GloVer-containing protein, partial [Candidatus Acidoferrum sp.]|nr:choice-of-anchor tandem repeat GloVer-containing protein [Candidatus Acidoferrum sp.]